MLFLNILLLFEKSDIDITSFKIRAPVYLTVSKLWCVQFKPLSGFIFVKIKVEVKEVRENKRKLFVIKIIH